jgi:hypothetical protein
MVRTVRGWMASKVLLNRLTVASGRSARAAIGSQDTYVFGWASRLSGRLAAMKSAAAVGLSSVIRPNGMPTRRAVMKADDARTCTIDRLLSAVLVLPKVVISSICGATCS